tara:strand:+ start:2176 stop:2817 length:642 start_codon:yes stop_codon:yes gene_type:complete
MDSTFPVVESFHSLQGEGAHTGRSAFFVRLASCKVGCPWCDTKISWSPDLHPKETSIEISEHMAKAQSNGAAFVVITGGEPLHHNLDHLCAAIRNTSVRKINKPIPIHIETSGVDQLSGNPDWITLSPKRHAPPLTQVLMACQELKVVISDAEDLLFAEEMATQVKLQTSQETFLFLQPVWNSHKAQILTFEYVKRNPKWRLSVQTHKWLKVS